MVHFYLAPCMLVFMLAYFHEAVLCSWRISTPCCVPPVPFHAIMAGIGGGGTTKAMFANANLA